MISFIGNVVGARRKVKMFRSNGDDKRIHDDDDYGDYYYITIKFFLYQSGEYYRYL